jgi:superfamily II DNA or RNA helicase
LARPELLDNREDETRHAAALAYLVGEVDARRPLAVATGYVDLGGLHELARILDGRPARLLLGAAPDPGLGAPPPIDRFQRQLAALRDERDFSRFPPSRAAERLAAVESWLAGPEVEVRRFTRKFLHGKAYLLGDAQDPRVALVTSANLTGAGLHRNLELGLTHYQPNVAGQAIAWFDELWRDAAEFGDELRALLFPDPGRIDPRTVYLRALLELHPPEPDDPGRASRPTGFELAPFQNDGYERARVIARRHGGVIYADGVGAGKTEIGLAFIEERTKEDGVYALVVTPAQLKRRWQERIDQAKLSAQVISFQELASDEQLVAADGGGANRHLNNRKDSYRLVLIDEAHALRNEDTTWYRATERLLGGARKQVVLLTATPINNGLWDLYNMVMLFARHDRAFSAVGIDSVRNLFLAAGANERDPESLSPEVLYPLADAVSVRRDRAFIERAYEGATFPDGTPVRFPKPSLRTHRYDLDASHPGLFESIAAEVDGLTMARYRPSAFDLTGSEENAEAQLAGLLKSGLLKRFESCWWACLQTVEHMLIAHEAFLAAWEKDEVLSRDELRAIATEEVGEAGLAEWLRERLADDGRRKAAEFDPAFGPAVAADRDRLAAIRAELAVLGEGGDPKLALLIRLLEESPAQKVAVFSTFGATVRYLEERLPERVRGRERVVVIGGETTPDERTAALARFAPETVVHAGYEPPAGEVDLLLSTDVLSEGQNLQQAQAVISYDMPWNPQRVVQRNGRVIRLRSPHDEVFLTTMLPSPGELERLLGLEARIQGKIKAASGVYGMESEVIEGLEAELRSFAERLADGDAELTRDAEEDSGAFVGEELRRLIDRAVAEGEVERVRSLPWGIGACFRQRPGGRSSGAPGVFFATRTQPMAGSDRGYRYWRYVEWEGDELVEGDLEILRRIDPQGGEPAAPTGIDLDRAWEKAAASIVAAHNARADLRAGQEQIGPRQRWALEVIRDPSVSLPTGVEQVDEVDAALSVERSSAVRRALREVQERLEAAEISRDAAAATIVEVVRDFGLRPVEAAPLPEKISVEELGVVCWMAVLPPA